MRRLMLEGVAAGRRGARRRPTPTSTRCWPRTRPAGRPSRRRRCPAPPRRARPAAAGWCRSREAGPAARGLARAAMSLDSDACTALLRASLAPVAGWSAPGTTCWSRCWPASATAGARTGAGVEVEHLLSECAEAGAARGVPATAGRPANARPVLLAALEPEDHRLPLVALAAALAERRRADAPARRPAAGRAPWPTRSRAPAPCAVFLWSQGAAGPALLPDPGTWAPYAPSPRPARRARLVRARPLAERRLLGGRPARGGRGGPGRHGDRADPLAVRPGRWWRAGGLTVESPEGVWLV